MAASANGTIPPEVGKAADELTANMVAAYKPLFEAVAEAEMAAAKTVIKDVVIQESVPWPFPSASEQAQAELEPLPAAPAVPVKVSLNTNLPTPEQMKVYVERLTKYRSDILPAGGMIPSHGMGVNKKLRAFISVANNGQEDLMKLTVAQWEATFAYMDQTLATQGAKELVKIIETNIEALSETNS
jgi:hypothetical protein